MKKCSRCKILKNASEFTKSSKSKDGFRYECKSCEKEYRDKNKDRQRKYSKQHYLDNKQKYIDRSKLYRINNPELSRYHKRNWALKNKDKIREKEIRHRECIPDFYLKGSFPDLPKCLYPIKREIIFLRRCIKNKSN